MSEKQNFIIDEYTSATINFSNNKIIIKQDKWHGKDFVSIYLTKGELLELANAVR